ncbi:MAG: DMT family transporter [Spirochaetales bacterium]|nr:DMT family transporter [Spirochaetales bacterium]
MNSSIIAIAAIIGGAALGASSGLYIKSLPFSSLALTGYRMCIPFLCLLPLMIRRKVALGPPRRRKQVVIASVFNGIRMLLYVLAYKLTSIASAVVLLYLWPLFALIINGIYRREKPNLREIVLILLAIGGVVLLNFQKGFSFSGEAMLGNISMILSALIFSVATLIFKEALKDHDEGEVVYFQNALGALVFLPFMIAESVGAPAAEIGLGLVYGLSVGILAWGFYFFALKRLPLFQYSALTYIEVFFGVVFGILFVAEDMTLLKTAGIALVLLASVLSRFSPSPGKAEKSQAPGK